MTYLLFYSVMGCFSSHDGFQQGFCLEWTTKLCYKGLSLVFAQDGAGAGNQVSSHCQGYSLLFMGTITVPATTFFLALPYAVRMDLGKEALFKANLLRIESSVLSKCKSVVYTDARKCKIRNEYVDFLSSNCISS